MRRITLVLAVAALCAVVSGHLQSQGRAASPLPRAPGVDFRVVSWNVSAEAFFAKAAGFRAMLQLVDADLFLLDEMDDGRSVDDVTGVLRGLRGETDTRWQGVIGEGGGYQRGAIFSRHPVRPVPELSGVVPYAVDEIARLKALVPESTWARTKANLDAGLAVAGAIVQIGPRSILAVAVDLQCCNGTPDWQEARRQIEARRIRSAVQAVLGKVRVDAVILAGDFNLVSSGTPLVILSGPYPAPHLALIAADALHLDGLDGWTWDGRDTPFPSRPLDFSMYGPNSLDVAAAVVVSTEDLAPAVRTAWGLAPGTSRELSPHLPIVVDYRWRRRGSGGSRTW